MGIYIDTAALKDIEDSKNYPFFNGVTTNPKLFAKTLGKKQICRDEFMEHVEKIKALEPGDIFIQTNYQNTPSIIKEAEQIHEILGDVGVIKIPVTLTGLQAMEKLHKQGIRTAATAVFTTTQAYLAMVCGADYVVPYYSRLEWSLQERLELIQGILYIIQRNNYNCRLLVASIKNPMQAMEVLRAGAHDLTVPVELIGEILFNSHTFDAVNEFKNALEIIKDESCRLAI